MLIAQITDPHIKMPGKLAYRRVDTETMLRRCIAEVAALDPQPDLIVMTGDLVDLGRPEEYAFLKTLLTPLIAPVIMIPGNHDEREAMREAFGSDGYLPASGFLHFSIDDRYPLRIIGLDTLVPREGRGELCAERLAWLEETLARAPGRPTLVLMHHPPFLTGIAHMDAIGLTGREAFAEIVSRHPQIELILCGHLHRHIQTMIGGRRVLTCPSPAHQVALDLKPAAPSCFRMEPPGYMLHRWEDGNMVSHAVAIGDYDGPYPFFDAAGKLID
ncbi:phosphodiesterase [Herbaspirillum sp. RTI4]|uniref:phosphodiesterase n=1 Tax=Herbaspirillum sp. RTI4 TaxID=3048640 RepID=UPI002AB3E1FF|nr:phosphodiesterase [Herbaspirillum sp. RTI4]MDY7579396.1 phosphodiesterase [Herbaspirillum sp. RTI4]MEA9980310.1 phosphodiesterase [Herbaspirillum sp. RTI4]